MFRVALTEMEGGFRSKQTLVDSMIVSNRYIEGEDLLLLMPSHNVLAKAARCLENCRFDNTSAPLL
jgi:hypothetical protein